jgi:hypothetical protein
MRNRLALVLKDTPAELFRSYAAGGLLNQKRNPIHVEHVTFERSLLECSNPWYVLCCSALRWFDAGFSMLNKDLMASGQGIDTHIAFATAFAFEEQHGRFPRLLDDEDASAFVEIAKRVAEERKEMPGEVCKPQKFEWGFPSGEPRDLDEKRLRRFARLFR